MKAAKYHIKKQKTEGQPTQPLWVDDSQVPLESSFSQDVLEQMTSLLDGQPKAVERSSGGMILVKPLELFIPKDSELSQEIKVKVLFRELETDSSGKVISKTCVTSSKVVLLSEVKKGFAYSKETCHNFVADFGMGLIPVRVISFREDAKRRSWAIFVRHDELESALLGSGSDHCSLTVYEIPADLLRQVEPISRDGKKDFSWARAHAKKLVDRGAELVPEVLRLTQVSVNSGLSLQEMDALLKTSISASGEVQEKSYHVISSLSDGVPDPLLPLNENTEIK